MATSGVVQAGGFRRRAEVVENEAQIAVRSRCTDERDTVGEGVAASKAEGLELDVWRRTPPAAALSRTNRDAIGGGFG